MSKICCSSGDVSVINGPSLGLRNSSGFDLSLIDPEKDILTSDTLIIKEGNESIGIIGGNKKDGYTLKILRGVTITDEMVPKLNKILKQYNLKLDRDISDPR